MEGSKTIVVGRTHGKGNLPCVSSGDNVLAVVRLDRTGGLTSSQAATLRNRCSVVTYTHINAGCGKIGCAEPLLNGRRQYSRARLDACTRETPRRKGGSMATRICAQSREGPISISETAGRLQTNNSLIWGLGPAHEVVVARMPVITSGKSEGPLGQLGCGSEERPGGLIKAPEDGRHKIKSPMMGCVRSSLKGSGPSNCSKAYRKPKGKAIGERAGLKPDWGNPAVRDFRGGCGNGGNRLHHGCTDYPLRRNSTRLNFSFSRTALSL